MVAMLANGAAGGREIIDPRPGSAASGNFVEYQWMLLESMADMAKLVIRDGKSASKFITIRVCGSPSYPARSISRLSLGVRY